MSRNHSLRGALRWAVVAVVVILGAVTLLFVRGPDFWQRQYYPLKYEKQIAASAARHRVNPYLIAAVIDAESSWRPAERSSAGAVGLMQLLPETARDLARSGAVDGIQYPVNDLTNPEVNIEYGTAYLRYLVNRYHEIETALAAYNAGLRHADRWKKKGGDIRAAIAFPETKSYVARVMRSRERYEQLYPDSFE
jgi:soluble lytic murein transglycosylase